MIGTHTVHAYPDVGSDVPSGDYVDVSCFVDDLSIQHGRGDAQSQPVASSATINLAITPDDPLPPVVDIGSWLVIATTVAGVTSTRFVGRVTDLNVGWDDAGSDTPESGLGQVVAVGHLADFARRVIGDEPFPQELDGARVARVFSLAGVDLDPITSDPGIYQIIPRDVDAQPALNVAQGTADSAGGLVWNTRDGLIRYADTDHRRGEVVALDLDVCDILVTPTWARSLAGLVNDVRVTYGRTVDDEGNPVTPPTLHEVNEGSKARWGRFEFSTTVELAEDTDAAALVALILGQNAAPVWMLQGLPIDVAGLDVDATQTLLTLDVHSLLRVGGFPVTGPTPTSVVAWVEGWTERLAWGIHELDLVVSDYCRTVPPIRWNDVLPSYLWDTVDAAMTWDSAACWGPPVNTGTWDTVPASMRWDTVDPTLEWDQTGGGVVSASVAA